MFSSAIFSKAEYNSRGGDHVIVFISMRFRLSRRKRYVCVFICIHFRDRFQIDAVSINTLICFSVDSRIKFIKLYAFSNENALAWTEPRHWRYRRTTSVRQTTKLDSSPPTYEIRKYLVICHEASHVAYHAIE